MIETVEQAEQYLIKTSSYMGVWAEDIIDSYMQNAKMFFYDEGKEPTFEEICIKAAQMYRQATEDGPSY